MQHFAGLLKKSIAGISCALVICFLPIYSFADETAPVVNSAPAVNSVPAAEVNSQSESTPIAAPASSVTAPVNTPKPAAQKVSSASQLASLLGGLTLIILLIYGLSWFVKRFAQGGFMQNPSMKVVSTLPMGTRERLMLVDVGGKQLLLGVTATQINTLHVFDEPVVPIEKAHAEKFQTGKTQPVASDFSQKLMAILQQKNYSPDDGSHKKSNS
jgi:flagellar protein FliO/FliZ